MTSDRQAPAEAASASTPANHDHAQRNPFLEELQAAYAQNDAGMPDEMKRQYPILNFDEMKARYPDEWIAFIPLAPQFRQRDAFGRVIIHSADIGVVDDFVLAFHEKYSDLPLSTDYTGQYEAKMSFLDAVLKSRKAQCPPSE